jgi:hypothetical protein
MNNVEFFKQNVNQIFTYLNQLDTYLEDSDNSAVISNFNEYKDELIDFSQMLANDNVNNNEQNTTGGVQ